MKKQLIKITSILTIFAPVSVFARATSFEALVNQLIGYIRLLVPFIISLALLLFLWGIFKLVFTTGSDRDLEEAKKFMFWGIVALFVMFSVWGLVQILTKTFFNGNVVIPQLRTSINIEQNYLSRV